MPRSSSPPAAAGLFTLAVSTYSLSRWLRDSGQPLEAALDWIAEHEIPAVEFCGLDAKAADQPVKRAGQLRRRCEKLGLKIAGYCTGAELLLGADAQKQAIEQLKREVDIAAELGVASMRHDVTTGPKPDAPVLVRGRPVRTFAQVLRHVVPAIRAVADHAAARGLRTSLENHGFYMQASARVRALIEAVDHPNFALTIDLGNFLCVNEDPLAAARRLALDAIMAHVKDFHVRPKKTMPPAGWFATPTPIALRGAIVGHGVLDVPRLLRTLQRAGYKGYLSLEFEGMEEPRFGVEQGLAYLRKVIAPS